VALADNKIG